MKRPNILLLFTDQQRFDTIQALGSSFSARTPHMDSLVREGVSFDNAFCTAPVCGPSRATLMTGLYPVQAGMPTNPCADQPPLSTALPTVGKRLRAAGYQTVYHGKSHLGGDLREHGFEVAEECSHDESTRLLASRFWKDRDWLINDRPFFHVVSFLNPHDLYFFDPNDRVEGFRRPWSNTDPATSSKLPEAAKPRVADWPEEKWGAYHEFYSRLIERVDGEIGETLHQLLCSGFFSNTWIIFTSDHGDMAGEHNLPFKGPFVFEGVTRVPLVIVPPQVRFTGQAQQGAFAHGIEPGRRSQLCSLVDIVPTILDLAGIAPDSELPGHSLLPLVRDETLPALHEYAFASWHRPGIRMVRSAEWKYALHENGEEELYHLIRDAGETKNLAGSSGHAQFKETLRAVLEAHLRSTNDTFLMHQAPVR